MHHKKDFKNLLKGDLRRVIGQLDDFVAAGAASTHILVAGAIHLPVAVARLYVGDAAHPDENRLGAPKTPAAQSYGFNRHCKAFPKTCAPNIQLTL